MFSSRVLRPIVRYDRTVASATSSSLAICMDLNDKKCDITCRSKFTHPKAITFYHETIHRPPGRSNFLIFVSSCWTTDGVYPPLNVSYPPLAFNLFTSASIESALVLEYLGSQYPYNVFEVKCSFVTGDMIGLMAIYKDIPFEGSDIIPDPPQRQPFSVPNSFRTTVPSRLHYYATASMTRTSTNPRLLHQYPSPVVFVVEDDY